MSIIESLPFGQETYGADAKPRMGFFTDTSVCIGCKACEVACKEWNLIADDGMVWTGESYDNTSELNADTWRHVTFIEQRKPLLLDGETASLDAEPLRLERSEFGQRVHWTSERRRDFTFEVKPPKNGPDGLVTLWPEAQK